jgi:hypothetical protein
MKDKVREVFLFVDGEEIKKIVDQELGGITFKVEIRHSRVVLSAWTGEDQKIPAVQSK